MTADPSTAKGSARDVRDRRRADALRENLRRRKVQARARAAEKVGMTGTREAPTVVSAGTREGEP